MAGDQTEDKTEQPTGKKLDDARQKGNVAQSREIPSVLILTGGMGVLFFGGAWMFESMVQLMRAIYLRAGTMPIVPETMSNLLWELSTRTMILVVPLMLVVMLAGVTGNVMQFGFLLTGEKLTPDLAKLNPISGLKKLFSLRSFVEMIKSVLKLLVIGGVAYAVIRRYLDDITGLMQLPVGGIVAFIGHSAFQVCLYTCMVLFLLSILDFAYTKWQHIQDLKMTKQEVKDEYKQREGDPAVKARIRSVQREMARRRMMEAVPEATVVITNPTHLAIAIRYEEGMHAPTVVAKGAGFVAQKIREIAVENDIPLVENKPLARTIFKTTEIGDFIPADLYRAVAEVLAYVYRLKGLAHA
jgi:flagellar biosynthesis protein FlhB